MPQKLERLEIFGKIITAPIQPADKLVNNPDITLSFAGVKNFLNMNMIDYPARRVKSSPKSPQKNKRFDFGGEISGNEKGMAGYLISTHGREVKLNG